MELIEFAPRNLDYLNQGVPDDQGSLNKLDKLGRTIIFLICIQNALRIYIQYILFVCQSFTERKPCRSLDTRQKS